MTKFARAAGGNWSSNSTWSSTSGGAADTVAPTAADDVVLNASSGNVTIDAASVCRSLDLTGNGLSNYTGTLTHNAFTLTIGDATAGANNIALAFPSSGWTYTLSDVINSALSFISTSATQQTVNFGGKTTGNVTFNAASNGSWQYTGAHTCGATATVTLTKGTLDINGKTCSWGKFSSANTNVRSLSLGAAGITVTGINGTVWDFGTNTNCTFTCGASTITCSGNSAVFNAGTLFTYNNVVMNGSGNAILGNSATFANFTRTGTAAKTDNLSFSGGTITVTGTFTCNGNSVTNRMLLQSNLLGTARTINAAVVSISNTDFMDITGAGAASWNLSAITGNSGDCGGNSGITFTTAAAQSWAGTSGGNWSSNAWTSRVPLPQDDVTISNAFSASQTISGDMPRMGKNINFTGVSGNPTWNPVNTTLFGSLTVVSGMSVTGAGNLIFGGRSSYTIASAGKQYTAQFLFNAPGGTYTLQDALSTTVSFVQNAGTFDANGFNVTAFALSSNGSITRTLTLGSGTWTLTATTSTTIWDTSGSNITLTGSSATIVIANTSTNQRNFAAIAGQVFGTLTYTVAGSTGAFKLQGGNFQINTFNFSDASNARTLVIEASRTITIRTSFNVFGSSGKLITINSGAGGSKSTISRSSGVISCDYLSIQDSTASGGCVFYAGANSTNVSNNSGWTFTAGSSTLTLTESNIPTESSLLRSLTRINSESITLTEIIIKATTRTITESALTLTELLSKATSKTLTTSLSLVETLLKDITRTISESLSLTETIQKITNFIMTLTESVTLNETLSKSVVKNISEVLSLIERIVVVANPFKMGSLLVRYTQQKVLVTYSYVKIRVSAILG